MSYQPQLPPSLVMRQGPRPNQAFSLHKTVLTLGRAADNDIVIDDGEVSRHHARLTLQGDNWVLEDLGSRNGTFVNGRRITGPVVLTPGSQVALGPDVLFSMEGGAPVAPVAPRPAVRRGGSQWLLLVGLAALVALILAGAVVLAYFYLNPPAEPSDVTELPTVSGPDVALQEPAPGTQVGLNAPVLVFATASDENRVTQVDLWVDDQLVTQQASPDPSGVTPLSLVHSWTADTPGMHALIVRAYNSLGAMGESPVLYVTVLEEPEPAPVAAQYVAQPGDTPATVAMVVNVSAAAIQGANPTISGVITSGQVIVVPVPPQPPASPQQGPVPGGPKPGGPVPGGAGQAAAPPPGPSNAPLKAPSLLKADAKDCSVTLVWQDNSEDEVGFLVFRQVFGAPGLLLLKTEKARNGTASQIQYVDQVPGPDTYLYYVEAAKAGGRAASNPLKVVVPPTAACAQAPGFKQVIFQPRNVEVSSRYNSLALFFDVGSGIYRRIPSGQGPGLPPGDWSGQRQVMPAPASVYLSPGAPVVLSVTGEGRGGRVSESLGNFSQTHPQNELSPTKEWSGQGAGFNMKYSLWLENVTWGKGTTDKIPAPTNLRFAKDANELSKIAGCAGGKCDSKTALVWDWPGDQKTIEGYILYRFYNCPGKDAQIMAPEVVVGPGNQGKVTQPAPAGCAARYQVSAFGPAGESEPSKALEVPANAPAAGVAVAFEELTINGGLARNTGRVYLQANQIILRSADVALQDRILLGRIVLDGKMPNNQPAVNLKKGESLQLGFRVQAGSNYCAGQEILSLQPGEDWTKYYGNSFVLKSKDNLCELTVKISQSAAGLPAAGQPAKPKTDIAVVDIYLSDQDVYAVLMSQGDPLQNNKINLGACWVDPNDEALCWTWEEIETSWPASASLLTTKVGNTRYAKRGWGREKFSVRFLAHYAQFDDPDKSNNELTKELELPRGGYGYTCSRNEECRSEYCADASPEHKGRCAPKDGSGQEGEYCHHGNHCASGVCQCPG